MPSAEVGEILPLGELELEIRAPQQSAVGRLTTYQVRLKNTTSDPVTRIEVRCLLPNGLRFPGFDSTELNAQTAQLEPGEVKEWNLSLLSETEGPLCSRFQLRSGVSPDGPPDISPPRMEREVCVAFVRREFTLEFSGPSKRQVNGDAEFQIRVGNPSPTPRRRVRLSATFDKALRVAAPPTETVPAGDGLEWDLGTLQPGAERIVPLELQCVSEARRACVRFELVAAGMEPERDEACLEIAPQTGSLQLQLSDRIDPLTVGRRGVYDLRLKNIALQPAREVALELQVPRELVVLSARLRRGGEVLNTTYTVQDDTLLFDRIDTLKPDEELLGVIEVEGLLPGTPELRATVTSSLNTLPTTTEETTVVLPTATDSQTPD